MEFKRASEYDTEGFRAVASIPRPNQKKHRYADLIDYFLMSNERFMAKDCGTDAAAKITQSSIINAIKAAGVEDKVFTVKRGATVYIAKGKREDY